MSDPVSVKDALGESGKTRPATCSCGVAFTQVAFPHVTTVRWIPAKCPGCRGIDDVERANSAEDARRALVLAELDVPKLYCNVTLESFQLHGKDEQRDRQGRILQLARRYVASWPDVDAVVVFRGAPGSGKGHVAWSIAKHVALEHRSSARVCKLPDVVRDLREAWRTDDGPSEQARLWKYRLPDLLVVDEVSRHAFYGEPRQHLYDLIDNRVERGKPTILTTNEEPAGLAELLGPALVSRAAGSGLWEFGNADWRLGRGAA